MLKGSPAVPRLICASLALPLGFQDRCVLKLYRAFRGWMNVLHEEHSSQSVAISCCSVLEGSKLFFECRCAVTTHGERTLGLLVRMQQVVLKSV